MEFTKESKARLIAGSKKGAAARNAVYYEIKKNYSKKCKNCNKAIIYEKRENTYCSRSCAAKVNNNKKRTLTNCCLWCNKRLLYGKAKFCSINCNGLWKYDNSIKKWKSGQSTGLEKSGVVSSYVKKYLREKYNNSCTLCGWSKVNQFTGKVPLNADHIDGNWQNNNEDNLRLLCGCCDSLTATYGGANRGKGRACRYI